MLEVQVRQTATTILKYAIRLAPPHTRYWGQAMMSELHYVEGNWAGTMWALGSSSVLVKQALVSAIVPNSQYVPDGGLFAKSASVRRAALAIGGACVLAALLFFASPPFRQAFQVAMKPWHGAAAGNYQPALARLARRAELRHDAEGMAFCAVRLENPRESARLAEEAVRLDPALTWVRAVVEMRISGLSRVGASIDRLSRWDSQNALFYLLKAESIEPKGPQRSSPPTNEQAQAWQNAMVAAFHAPKFDDYLDRVAQLYRRVIPRYGFYDPYEVVSRAAINVPPLALQNSERFAKLLLQTGADREAKGDRKGARDQYWTVARFGQLIDSCGRTDREQRMGTTLQSMAYGQLQGSYLKQGDPAEAALFGYLVAKFDLANRERAGLPPPSTFGRETAERNAAVVEISGLMILAFSGLVLIASLILIAGSRRSARPAARRAKPVAIIVILTSAVGLLFSAITLYLTYRPYWYIFQSAVLSGDEMPGNDLGYFLNYTPTLQDISPRGYQVLLNALLYSGSPGFLFYVWTGVTLLGVIGLVLIVVHRFRSPPRADPPQ